MTDFNVIFDAIHVLHIPGSSFSDKITIMIRHYVIHPRLKTRHYVIHPTICIYTNAKFIVICKPRTLNDGGEDSVEYRNCKKHCFLAAAISLFIGKIIITR